MTPQARQAMLCGGCEREGCRLCFLYNTREDYRLHWDGKSGCVHFGAELRKERCQLCGDRERWEPVYQCVVHGECTLRKFKYGTKFNPKVCAGCESRIPVVDLVK